jgi:hypothetical protein
MACWYKPTSGGDYGLVSVAENVGGDSPRHLLYQWSNSGNPRIAMYSDNGVGAQAVAAANSSTGAWNHACGVVASTSSRTAYLNGGNSGTDATGTSAISTCNQMAIGAYYSGGGLTAGFYLDGSIAEAAIWNVALTAAEVAVLGKGYSPLLIRPSALVFYAPLVRELQDIRGGRVLTNNSTTVSDHTRIIMPKKRQPYSVAAAGGGGVTYARLERGVRGLHRGLAQGSYR